MNKISTGLAILGLMSAAVGAHADTLTYATVDGGDYGTLDLTTGAYNNITLLASGTLAGLGDLGGTLYGAAFMGDSLYRINPATGAETVVPNTSTAAPITYYDFGATLTGLYALDSSGNLFSINSATTGAVKIGNIGLDPGYSNLSDNSGTLYFDNAGTLYTVNTSTAKLTSIGTLTGDTALVTAGGTLYGVSNVIYSYNTSTNTQTMGAAVTGESQDDVYGLAPDPLTPVPLPGGAVLLLSGMALLALAVGRRGLRPAIRLVA